MQIYTCAHRLYRFLFAHRFFYKWNRWVLHCGLKGLGVGNFDKSISGERACLKRILSNIENPIIIDVGANVGHWSLTALKANPSAQIFAFEPNSIPFEKLKTINSIKSFNVACGATNEKRMLYDRNDKVLSTHASLDIKVLEEHCKDSLCQSEVEVICLDDFFAAHTLQHIELLKIDVEGFEYEVLKGAQNTLANGKISFIMFEFNDMNVLRKRYMRDFFKFLPQYSFYRLLPNGMIPLRHYDPLYHELFGYQNILAVLKTLSV